MSAYLKELLIDTFFCYSFSIDLENFSNSCMKFLREEEEASAAAAASNPFFLMKHDLFSAFYFTF